MEKHIILPSENLGLTKAIFESLPEEDMSKQLFNGTLKYVSPSGFFQKLYHALYVQPKQFEMLEKLYPYQRNIKMTRELWEMYIFFVFLSSFSFKNLLI